MTEPLDIETRAERDERNMELGDCIERAERAEADAEFAWKAESRFRAALDEWMARAERAEDRADHKSALAAENLRRAERAEAEAALFRRRAAENRMAAERAESAIARVEAVLDYDPDDQLVLVEEIRAALRGDR